MEVGLNGQVAMAEKNISDHGRQLNNMAYFSSINSPVWATRASPLQFMVEHFVRFVLG